MIKHPERKDEQYDPPSADEMLAYSRGQLSPEKAAEVWERLEQYPDLAAIYTAPFPEDGGDYVTPDRLDARWTELRTDLGIPSRKVVWFPRVLSVAAAALILVLGGSLWQTQKRVRDLETQLATPRVPDEHVLSSEANYRGVARSPSILRPDADAKLIVPTRGDYGDYEVEIRTLGAKPRSIWRQGGLIQSNDNEIEIVLLRTMLKPGKYQLILYGSDAKQLDTFTFEVE